MNSIRLLPVVVAAAAALLIFKAIGVVSGSGYVLGGPDSSLAQDAVPGVGEAPPADAAARMLEGADPAGGAPLMADTADTADAAEPDPGLAAGEPTLDELMAAAQAADADPMRQELSGALVPFDETAISGTERQILVRLAERRAQLDQLAADLELRAATVEAAELRLEQRIAELTALEAEVNALLAQKQADDDGQFAALVSMYETMKPKDAAAIFDRLGIDILTRVAIAMNPRKMSPILAAMAADRAEVLTIALATIDPEPMRDPNAVDLASLPQIVGQ